MITCPVTDSARVCPSPQATSLMGMERSDSITLGAYSLAVVPCPRRYLEGRAEGRKEGEGRREGGGRWTNEGKEGTNELNERTNERKGDS